MPPTFPVPFKGFMEEKCLVWFGRPVGIVPILLSEEENSLFWRWWLKMPYFGMQWICSQLEIVPSGQEGTIRRSWKWAGWGGPSDNPDPRHLAFKGQNQQQCGSQATESSIGFISSFQHTPAVFPISCARLRWCRKG